MYLISSILDTLRVPPDKFAEDLHEILLELARETIEEQIYPEIGFVVAVLEAEEVGIGKIIPGDGGAFYDVKFKVLSYLPEKDEVVEGRTVDITDFGVFVRVGIVDALCHVSQIADDFFSFNQRAQELIGKESGLRVRLDDIARGRVIAVGLGKQQIRVGITMRQPGLGLLEWVEKWKADMLEKRAEA